MKTTIQNDRDEFDDDSMPLEDQLRLTAVQNPCLLTNEVVVLTNAQAAAHKGVSRAKRAPVPA
jgi:hypothetical protein